MALNDAQGTQFSFDSVDVGGIIRYEARDGVTDAPEYRPLSGGAVESRPGNPAFGELRLVTRIDPSNAGIQRLITAHANSEIATGRIVRADGTGFQFQCFVRSIPLSGAITGTEEATIRIKITGPLLPL